MSNGKLLDIKLSCPKACERIEDFKNVKKQIGDIFVELEDYYHALDFPALLKNKIEDYNEMRDHLFMYFVFVTIILRKFCIGDFNSIDDFLRNYGDLRAILTVEDIEIRSSVFKAAGFYSPSAPALLAFKTPMYWATEEIPKFIKKIKAYREEPYIDASMLLEKLKSVILHNLVPLEVETLNDIEMCLNDISEAPVAYKLK